jgi:hypothetical protein
MEVVMPRRAGTHALILALALAGPAVAEERRAATDHLAVLIHISALTLESDFTVFMHKDVPEQVRRAALRRLWRLIELPVSCYELCQEPEPAAPGFAHLASWRTLAAAIELSPPGWCRLNHCDGDDLP